MYRTSKTLRSKTIRLTKRVCGGLLVIVGVTGTILPVLPGVVLIVLGIELMGVRPLVTKRLARMFDARKKKQRDAYVMRRNTTANKKEKSRH